MNKNGNEKEKQLDREASFKESNDEDLKNNTSIFFYLCLKC